LIVGHVAMVPSYSYTYSTTGGMIVTRQIWGFWIGNVNNVQVAACQISVISCDCHAMR